MKKLILLIAMLLSLTASAATMEGGSFVVSELRFGTTATFVTLSPAPKGCEGGTQYGAHLRVDSSNAAHYQIMVSGLLAAYTSGAKLAGIWFNDEGACTNTHILNLYMYKYQAK